MHKYPIQSDITVLQMQMHTTCMNLVIMVINKHNTSCLSMMILQYTDKIEDCSIIEYCR